MTKHSTKRGERTGPLWWVTSVVSWTLLLAISAVIIATIVVPFFAGAQRFTILTGSMRPTYNPGSLVVVKPVDPSELGIGTPITYQLESGQPTVVTHRIIATSENQKGERTFITQGDANGEPDEKEVRPVQIRGKVWYSLPYLGYVNTWLTGEQRTVIVVIVVTALLLYASYMMISGIRDGRKERARARLAPDPATFEPADSAQIEKGQHDALAP
ncbi:signal peptidase I [Rhodococcus qingshengii]|uniref:signal peptidase I n=1 Tax=Rhodococcus qingshengii TaxID=334542 RepID=UPI0006427480|nr:signal peptidase I [Rhodococcus qingshengii]KLN72387.1 signal peptidase I [Rhodococcus erythropolis]QPG88446.1 signal peptidase I [Rhodococcus qingshengii]